MGECGGCGTCEVAARYSYIKLNPAGAYQTAAPPRLPWGGVLKDMTLGVNWYLNQYTKFPVNHIIANNNRGSQSSVCDLVALRARLDF